MSGKARYKDHDEEKAKLLEEKYSSREKKIDFPVLSVQSVQEIKGIIRLLKVMLEKENGNWDKVKEQNDEYKAETGFTDRKIKAYDKLELTDEQQIVLDALRQNCVEETLWSAIAAFQNYPFRTSLWSPIPIQVKNWQRRNLQQRASHRPQGKQQNPVLEQHKNGIPKLPADIRHT